MSNLVIAGVNVFWFVGVATTNLVIADLIRNRKGKQVSLSKTKRYRIASDMTNPTG